MMEKRVSMFVACAALAALTSGCIVDVDSAPPSAGTLTAVWTIDNSTDPAACQFYARDPNIGLNFELLVYERRVLVAEVKADCAAFNTSLRLRRGTYDATATMVDPITDAAVSTTLPMPAIEIFRETETTVDINFPPESFPGRTLP